MRSQNWRNWRAEGTMRADEEEEDSEVELENKLENIDLVNIDLVRSLQEAEETQRRKQEQMPEEGELVAALDGTEERQREVEEEEAEKVAREFQELEKEPCWNCVYDPCICNLVKLELRMKMLRDLREEEQKQKEEEKTDKEVEQESTKENNRSVKNHHSKVTEIARSKTKTKLTSQMTREVRPLTNDPDPTDPSEPHSEPHAEAHPHPHLHPQTSQDLSLDPSDPFLHKVEQASHSEEIHPLPHLHPQTSQDLNLDPSVDPSDPFKLESRNLLTAPSENPSSKQNKSLDRKYPSTSKPPRNPSTEPYRKSQPSLSPSFPPSENLTNNSKTPLPPPANKISPERRAPLPPPSLHQPRNTPEIMATMPSFSLPPSLPPMRSHSQIPPQSSNNNPGRMATLTSPSLPPSTSLLHTPERKARPPSLSPHQGSLDPPKVACHSLINPNLLTNDPKEPAASDQQGFTPVYGQQAVHHHYITNCPTPQQPIHDPELVPLPHSDPLPHLEPQVRVLVRTPARLAGEQVDAVDAEAAQDQELVTLPHSDHSDPLPHLDPQVRVLARTPVRLTGEQVGADAEVVQDGEVVRAEVVQPEDAA